MSSLPRRGSPDFQGANTPKLITATPLDPAAVRRKPVTTALRRLRALAIVGCLVGPLVVATPRAARAAGNESLRRAYDLALTVDSRWAGGANGGYYPIRIRLTNTAGPRDLVFRFVDTGAGDSKLPAVERRVHVDQNATLQFTLSVPLVGLNSMGELRIYEKGRPLADLTQHLGLPDAAPGSNDRPSLLVIHPSPTAIDCSKFEEAVQALSGSADPIMARSGLRMRLVGASGSSGVRSNDYQVIAPVMLPESWIDYSALDIVAIPLAAFDKLPAAARAALLAWTDAGGTLIVTDVGESPSQSKDLARLLDLSGRTNDLPLWQAAQPALHQPIPVSAADPSMAMGGLAGGMMVVVPGVEGVVNPLPPNNAIESANQALWKISPDTFSHVDRLAGRVYAFPGDPFLGSPVDWGWWLNSSKWQNRLNWTVRHGTSSRQRHPEFLNFLIPGVGGVPILAFVLLISLFAIVIGPVNYFVVLRRKQLYLLVLTIPVIAFATSCALFGYSLIADGFGVKSRLRSLTLLDQRTRQAVSFNRISLYAGLAPSAGLRFSPETAVLPIWSDDSAFESGTVDWTDTQNLTAGWLRSGTSAQFETVEHRTLRGRVEFTSRTADEPPEAANGLEWPIEALLVRDEAGRLWAGGSVPAGGTARMHVAATQDLQNLTRALHEFKLEAPQGVKSNDWTPFTRRSRTAMMASWTYGSGNGTVISFSQSTLERGLRRVNDLQLGDAPPPNATQEARDDRLVPRSYLATFRDNPGIELGIEHTHPKAGVHVLLGFY
ncbi:MAG: hypothetical protein EXS05_08490 [Planctomycetaceae bacterium]|nr:hypothetical protein [Planctomycetaceae bacterium]